MFINFYSFIKLQISFTTFMMFLPFQGVFLNYQFRLFIYFLLHFKEYAYEFFTKFHLLYIFHSYVFHQLLKTCITFDFEFLMHKTFRY